MPRIFLIPAISIFDVHDTAVRDWLNKQKDSKIREYLDYPYRLDNLFLESVKQAIICAERVYEETLKLVDSINPQAVFLEISQEHIKLENDYNSRKIASDTFWKEYYKYILGSLLSEAAKLVYQGYMERTFRRMARLIENLDHHPLRVVFYDIKEEDKEKLVPIYEEALDRDGDFVLKLARMGSDMAAFKEIPRYMWYTTMRPKQMAISYEETEDFYEELYSRYQRLLRFKIREYIVKRVGKEARIFLASYEKFLDSKILEEEQKARNIQEALPLLIAQAWEVKNIVIYCAPIYYEGLHTRLEKSLHEFKRSFSLPKKDISKLLEAMKPFTQKNRIMQGNYSLALNILGLQRPTRYSSPSACLIPLKKEAA